MVHPQGGCAILFRVLSFIMVMFLNSFGYAGVSDILEIFLTHYSVPAVAYEVSSELLNACRIKRTLERSMFASSLIVNVPHTKPIICEPKKFIH